MRRHFGVVIWLKIVAHGRACLEMGVKATLLQTGADEEGATTTLAPLLAHMSLVCCNTELSPAVFSDIHTIGDFRFDTIVSVSAFDKFVFEIDQKSEQKHGMFRRIYNYKNIDSNVFRHRVRLCSCFNAIYRLG